MATGFRDFSADTIGSPAPGVTTVNIGTGSANVESVTGASGGRALVLRPQAASRHALALLDAIEAAASTDIEIIARVRFPSGTEGFFQGGGVVARVDDVGAFRTGYGAVYNDSGLANPNSLGRGLLASGFTEIAGANLIAWPNQTNVWLRVLLRVNSTSIRSWFGNDAGWTKTNASTPDAQATDATYTAGIRGGIRWDTNTSLPMEIDWIGWGTAGDAAPTSAGGPPPETFDVVTSCFPIGYYE